MDHIVEKVYKRLAEASQEDLMKLDAQVIISTNYQISDILTTIRANSVPGVLSFKMRPAREK